MKSESAFCTNYFNNLENTDAQNNAQKIYDDIKRYKKYRKELEKSEETQKHLPLIDWFIARLRFKRDEIIEGYQAPKQKLGKRDIVIIDPSYDIRDIKPYSYFVSKMEKDLRDNEKAILKSKQTMKRMGTFKEDEKKDGDDDKPIDHNDIIVAPINGENEDDKEDENIEESKHDNDDQLKKANTKGVATAAVAGAATQQTEPSPEKASTKRKLKESEEVSSLKFSNYDYDNED